MIEFVGLQGGGLGFGLQWKAVAALRVPAAPKSRPLRPSRAHLKCPERLAALQMSDARICAIATPQDQQAPSSAL